MKNRRRINHHPMGDIPQNLYPDKVSRAGNAPQGYVNNIMPQGRLPVGDFGNSVEQKETIKQTAKFVSLSQNVGDSSSNPVLNANENRSYLIVQNNGAADVYINFGSKAVAGLNIKIIAGGNYEPNVTPVDSIYLVSDAGLSNLCAIVEGV